MKALFHKQCQFCAESFETHRPDAKFCAMSCYGKSQRRNWWSKCAQCLRDIGLTANQASSILRVNRAQIAKSTKKTAEISAKSWLNKSTFKQRKKETERKWRDRLFAETGYRTTPAERNAAKRDRHKYPVIEDKEKKKARAKRYLADPSNRLRSGLGRRLYKAMKHSGKSPELESAVGCSMEDLKDWIESQFAKGMTWENYGTAWHVDHIHPCASFDHTKPDQVRRCWHFTNLRPLWAKENIAKGARITEPQMLLGV